mmetsp:Transcript_174700/g.560285  ORF Transcript_174700/g.560285 Transcript_174700/m.560285 type:complete len:359 (+) Transcript_174700:51-1127(+)
MATRVVDACEALAPLARRPLSDAQSRRELSPPTLSKRLPDDDRQPASPPPRSPRAAVSPSSPPPRTPKRQPASPPPRTPRAAVAPSSPICTRSQMSPRSPSPQRRKRRLPESPPSLRDGGPQRALQEAFKVNTRAGVEAAIQEHPEATYMPFWGPNCEPLICWAVKCGCSLEVVGLLLERGASKSDAQVALEALCEQARQVAQVGGAAICQGWTARWMEVRTPKSIKEFDREELKNDLKPLAEDLVRVRVAGCLLAAGADPPGHYHFEKAFGKEKMLPRLLKYYRDVQACIIFNQALRPTGQDSLSDFQLGFQQSNNDVDPSLATIALGAQFDDGLLLSVLSFVLPGDIVHRVFGLRM